MASDSVRSGPTNYEDSTPDTFAYRSPNKNPFLPFGYPRVKKRGYVSYSTDREDEVSKRYS